MLQICYNVNVAKKVFSQLIFEFHHEMERQAGHRISLTDLADNYLSTEELLVSRSLVSLWESGNHEPSLKYVDHLASIIGHEVYDVLGLQRPDPLLSYATSNIDKLTEDQKTAIREQIQTYLAENELTQLENSTV